LPNSSTGLEDAKRLQPIILQLFEGIQYKENRITTKIAKVIYILLL